MSANDEIIITGITALGRHGVLEQERRHGQTFTADVTLSLDFDEAARTDDLKRTVDYDRVARAVVNRLSGDPVDLIETLAVRIADDCLSNPLVSSVVVTVHKASAPVTVKVQDVAATVRRSRARSQLEEG